MVLSAIGILKNNNLAQTQTTDYELPNNISFFVWEILFLNNF